MPVQHDRLRPFPVEVERVVGAVYVRPAVPLAPPPHVEDRVVGAVEDPPGAERLEGEGYQTVAAVGNPVIERQAGYAQGFEHYFEAWRMPRMTPFTICVVYELYCLGLFSTIRVACRPSTFSPAGS